MDATATPIAELPATLQRLRSAWQAGKPSLAQRRADSAGIALRVPSPRLCTDNGAMVASLGAALMAAGRPPSGDAFDADSALPVTTPLL